ncbi:MAG TPA: 2-amino-4-hydroxy-6-hydroxymethyldihydropteridine diphosphokinase [Dokdonella sp.]|uniref:2-amino-4-hydroxy-6- hydroxymethyldihydropteridine diphosphokinase n=1 Tax=Dokdonella sp. TaxID=2291710 RepID=UPI002C6C8822|nr:2-amino-4-hydroxy-6-hydroxymethyldihydropteridine diphosphokinase [Dokdonella sp.]HUD43645.1 2-amino-4-hydroxy-6-hydroxymethyldihydropteridine diphosphokinase [Dokdonella sp.]
MARAYLSLGSNIEPARNLCLAFEALRERFSAVALSPVYRSPAVGFDGADFLNAAAVIDSDLAPAALAGWLREQETRQGRRRGEARYASRPIDLDLLLYGDQVSEVPPLPRPELASDAFVLRPMADLAPTLRHPSLGVDLATLWARCADSTVLTRVTLDCAAGTVAR